MPHTTSAHRLGPVPDRVLPVSWLQRVRAPLTAATTYRGGVYLLLGAVILLPYVLLTAAFVAMFSTTQQQPGSTVLLIVTLVVAATPAFLTGVRSVEISAAREILGADVALPSGRASAGTRVRAASWYVVHLLSGGLLAAVLFLAVPTGLIFILQRFGTQTQILDTSELGFLSGVDRWVLVALGVGLLVSIPYATAAAGAGLRRLAPLLLGPSPEERIAALEQRARQLAERNRLARELHDSVGHALTITTVQAAAAQQVLDRDPVFVARALAAIEEAGRTAMADLDHVLGLLRDGAARATAPQPGLADLPRLVEDTRGTGIRITSDLADDLVEVPAAVSREGYRIVQEALTNAIRHADGAPVDLRVRRASGGLRIEVTNLVLEPGASAQSERGRTGLGGRGLTGMAERVRVLGGELEVGSRDGQWRICARLPGGITGADR